MGFPRQEYWSGLSFVSPGDLPEPGIEPMSPALQVDSLSSEPPVKPQMDDRRILIIVSTLPHKTRFHSFLENKEYRIK